MNVYVVDTNVPVVANGRSEQADQDCVIACIDQTRATLWAMPALMKNRGRALAPVAAAALCLALLAGWPRAGEVQTAPATRPAKAITLLQGEAGDLLRTWYARGTAAGNWGDFYDNRDRGHSELDLRLFPQLEKIRYSEEDRAANRDWAAQRRILPGVVFGNSSTAAGAAQGGSNARMFYSDPAGLAFLYAQYTRNNLYIYPCHKDHDPGHNGEGGFGDLFPANTPYVIISQGSSFTDKPFMQAVALTLAAFRPEVKQKLIETGTLMPTVQMIFRASNRNLALPREYLLPKAHPTVFEGSWVDELKMIRVAQLMTLERLPPVVQLRVVAEDTAANGVDYFEGQGVDEKLGDTPAAIARIWRSSAGSRRMIVSADGSFDHNRRPLTWHWVLLRGDPARVSIRTMNDSGSLAEIHLHYHERRPVAPGSRLESNRVDIGVVVHNGIYYSAPAFITFYTLDSELRTYDEAGRPLEIGYGAGTTSIAVADWSALFERLAEESAPPGIAILRRALGDADAAVLAQLAGAIRAAHVAVRDASAQHQKAQAVAQQSAADLKAAEQRQAPEAELAQIRRVAQEAQRQVREAETRLAAARRDLEQLLSRPAEGMTVSPRAAIESALRRLLDDPMLGIEKTDQLDAAAAASGSVATAVAGWRGRLVNWGLARRDEAGVLHLTPVRGGDAPLAQRLTAFERFLVQRLNADLLENVLLPGLLTITRTANFVDFRISPPRTWRDIYRYDSDGQAAGWVRYDGRRSWDFGPQGHEVLGRDELGRPLRLRPVHYERVGSLGGQGGYPALRVVPSAQVLHYEYRDDSDKRGRAVRAESTTTAPAAR